METLETTEARTYVALWFYSQQVKENLEPGVFKEAAAC